MDEEYVCSHHLGEKKKVSLITFPYRDRHQNVNQPFRKIMYGQYLPNSDPGDSFYIAINFIVFFCQ